MPITTDARADFLNHLPADVSYVQQEDGLILQPADRAGLIATIQLAHALKIPLLPVLSGESTLSDAVRLDCSRLDRLIHHRPEEFLITVESGMTFGRLAEHLESRRQRLGQLHAKNRTLLSVLAEETLSLSVTRHGPLRHNVVGIEAVTGDGQPVHFGGEVVKNVTGYDLGKLWIGSRHQFGIISRVTLKLEPWPERSDAFLFHLETLNEALEMTRQLLRLLPNPEVLTLFRTKNTFGWQILVVISGYREMVQQAGEQLHAQVSQLNADTQELYLAPKAQEQWIQKLDWLHPEEPEALVVRIALTDKTLLDLPHRFLDRDWLKSADLLMPQSCQQMQLRWIAVNMPTEAELLAFQAEIQDLGGFLEIIRVPLAGQWKPARFNQPSQRVLQTWQARLKHQYDPNGILPNRNTDKMPMNPERQTR